MTDDKQELLTKAALACGHKVIAFEYGAALFDGMNTGWNPLIDSDLGKVQCWKMEEKLRLTIAPEQNQWVISKGDLELARHEDRQIASVMAAAKLYELFGDKSEK